MTTVLMGVWLSGVILFLAFLWQSGSSRRSATRGGQPRTPHRTLTLDLQPGTRTVAGFDHQGSKRLRSHQPDVLTLLIGALLMSAVAVVKAQESDDTGASSAAVTAEQDGNTAEGAASNVTSDTARAVPPAAPAVTSTTRTGNFFQRFGKAYLADWQGTTDSGPEPKYRGFPAPVTNPPFPFAVWTYKGSVTIGYPWTQSGPLMQAIWSGKDGEAWKKSGIQVIWLDQWRFQRQDIQQRTLRQCTGRVLCCAQLDPARPDDVLHRAPAGYRTDGSFRLGLPDYQSIRH